MLPPPIEPMIERKALHQFLVEGFQPICEALPPSRLLPYGGKVPISCHPAGEADVEE